MFLSLALKFGADDYGGVLMTEEVVSATGLEYGVTEDQVINMIHEAGFVPAQRTTQYDLIKNSRSSNGRRLKMAKNVLGNSH